MRDFVVADGPVQGAGRRGGRLRYRLKSAGVLPSLAKVPKRRTFA